MPQLLTIHHEPGVSKEKIQSRWMKLARERRATWIKTWFNLEIGKRYCWWGAPSKEVLEDIFRDHDVPWEEMLEVKHTTPAEWVWRED